MTIDPNLIFTATGFLGVIVAVIGTGVAIAMMNTRQHAQTNKRFDELKADLTKRLDEQAASQHQMKQDLEKSFDRSLSGVQGQLATMQNQMNGMQEQMNGFQEQMNGLQLQMHNVLEASGKLGGRVARIEGILTRQPAGYDEDEDIRVASGDD